MRKIDLDTLIEDWGSPFVARSRLYDFTKGLYKPSTMNTYDAKGVGIERYRLKSKVFYKAEDVVNWIKSRARG